MQRTTCGGRLPEELIMEILSRLPVKTVVRFKCASNSWRNLIMSPEFVNLHLHRSLDRNSTVTLIHSGHAFLGSFDFDHPQRPVVQLHLQDIVKYPDSCSRLDNGDLAHPPEMIGICNGVVCFAKADEFILYNPATRAYKQVPRLNRKVCPARAVYHDEFGYHCIADDYKVFSFSVYIQKEHQYGYQVYLYSLKDNSWLKIGSPPNGFRVARCRSHVANNSLHWITYNYESKTKVILRFDLSSHIYEEMSLPTKLMYSHGVQRLGVLKGRLHIMKHESSIDIWMLKEDNCWSQVFSSSKWKLFSTLVPYAYSKDGRKIMVGPVKKKFEGFICCDIESETTSMVKVVGLPENATFTAMPWVESLVPLS